MYWDCNILVLLIAISNSAVKNMQYKNISTSEAVLENRHEDNRAVLHKD
jgi:hypothetical protein